MTSVTRILPLVAVLAFINVAQAHDHNHKHDHDHKHEHKHDEQEDHGAHTHGLANIAMVFEGKQIDFSFSAPAESIVGFEHKATNKKEKQNVKDAREILSSAKNISSLINYCQVVSQNIDTEQLLPTTHDHGHDHEHGSKSKHAEVEFNYRFECDDISDIDTISIELFNHFPRLERIRTVWLTNTAQGMRELTRKNNTFNLD